MQPRQGILAVAEELFQLYDGLEVFLLHEQYLSYVALPTAGTIEGRDELSRGHLVQTRNRPRLGILGGNTIEAAFVFAATQIKLLLPVFWNPLWMLNDVAIHVGDPQRSIGAGLDGSRSKPIIGRREKLGLLLVVGPPTGKAIALGRHDFAVHQVMHGFANKHVAGEGRAKKVIAIDDGAASRGETAGGMKIIEARQNRGHRKNGGVAADNGNDHARIGRRQQWIAFQVMFIEDIVPKRLAVV